MNTSYVPGSLRGRSLIDSLADTTTHRDRDSLNSAVVQLLFDFLPLTSVMVFRLEGDPGAETLLPVAGAPAPAPGQAEPFRWQECIAQRTPSRQRIPEGDFLYLFPIEAGRELIGLLAIQAPEELHDKHINLMHSILRILRNHVELLEYGERDTLTRLLNRRTFESRFDKLRRSLQTHRGGGRQTSWIAELDIDKFKSINDTYGHLFGDEVLLLLSQIMQQCFRGSDQLFRFGGEEFVIVLDDASDAGARIAYERMRDAVETFAFPQVGRVTVSIGYSPIKESDGPASCIERADAALYYAKHNGRNRVCHFEDLVASGELQAKIAQGDAELF